MSTLARNVQLRVVIIDDYEDDALMIAHVFEALGHQPRVALDGPSGLSLVLATAPHLVIVDLVLPHMCGWSIAGAIRAMPLAAQPRLIAISGYDSVEDRKRSFAAGFDAHLAKPFGVDVLAHFTEPRPN